MNVLKDVNLKSKNTFHIDGMANNYYIPENETELVDLLKNIEKDKYYILSGGSNILINDSKEYKHIISMEEIDKSFEEKGNGVFYIGASLRIQEIINRINELGYGGIEKMYSIPAMFGGIVYMNAGIGPKKSPILSISDFIVRVKALNKQNKTIEWIDKKDCFFSHRKSIFQNDEYVILGAECKFEEQSIEISKSIIDERICNFSKKAEYGKGTFGTVFSSADGRILKLVSFFHKKKGDIYFGKKNKNWFVNGGAGTYKDAMYLINKTKKIHKLFHKEIECEVRIWE